MLKMIMLKMMIILDQKINNFNYNKQFISVLEYLFK